MKVGSQFLPMSITVMEQGPDFLFGLDMLRRYQCAIDLKADRLRFNTEPEVALPFLAEHEIPAATRFELRNDEDAPGARATSYDSMHTIGLASLRACHRCSRAQLWPMLDRSVARVDAHDSTPLATRAPYKDRAGVLIRHGPCADWQCLFWRAEAQESTHAILRMQAPQGHLCWHTC